MLDRLGMIGLLLAAAFMLTACQTTSPMKTAAHDGWNHYGDEGLAAGQVIAMGAVSGGESDVVVEATIVDVCAQKGCWMKVQDGDDELFVRFKDYGFFVPRNAAGHRVVMHGKSVAEVTSVEELRHYAEDAGESPDSIAAITEPKSRVIFFADSVYIEGDGLDEPHAE